MALFAGQTAALVTAGVVIVLLTFLSWVSGRRKLWLEGDQVVAKALGRKIGRPAHVDKIELMVTDIRGTRTVGLLLTNAPQVDQPVARGLLGRRWPRTGHPRAAPAGRRAGGQREHRGPGVLPAAGRPAARGGKGRRAADRPLYRLASLAPAGKLAQRLKPEAITRFVASLD